MKGTEMNEKQQLMDSKELMGAINSFPEIKIAVAITGGGTSAIGEMLRHGGSSDSVLYAHVPYSPSVTEQYLGCCPEDKLCSAATARMLAMKAYDDVVQHHGYEEGVYPVGIGATSALGKIETEREGREHKIYVAVQNREKTITYTLFLTEPRSREEEEKINEGLILSALAAGCNIDCPINVKELSETLNIKTDEGDLLELILCNEHPAVVYNRGYVVPVKGNDHVDLLFPASFNPLHDAHLGLAKIASEISGHPCHFEMTIANADKAPLDYTEIYRRFESFDEQEWEGDLWVTRLPTFVEKAEYFAPITFVVGADTVGRICDPRFYGGSETKMLAALQRMSDLGTKFMCFARKIDGEIIEAFSSNPPEVFIQMATAIGSSVFASSISSTEIRRGS
jgi:hypothetical protein